MPARSVLHAARAERGFTLVELMVTVAIALFLLGGLVTVVGNVRKADVNQRALAQLQDQERFALTVITDVVQAGGYFPDSVMWTPASSLLQNGNWEAGQAPRPLPHPRCRAGCTARWITSVPPRLRRRVC